MGVVGWGVDGIACSVHVSRRGLVGVRGSLLVRCARKSMSCGVDARAGHVYGVAVIPTRVYSSGWVVGYWCVVSGVGLVSGV